MYDTIMSMSGTIKVVLVENGRYIKEFSQMGNLDRYQDMVHIAYKHSFI